VKTHALEALLARGLFAAARTLPWPGGLAVGAALGDAARLLGIRRRVAEANLALAFPERTAAERSAILAAHYREVGRIAAEYARLPEMARSADDSVVGEVHGREHLESLRGRGAVVMTGHFGNFELFGAWATRVNPIDFVVKPLSNPRVEAMVARLRANAGVGVIPLGGSLKHIFRALREGHWVALLADQDARQLGAFVPFFGRLASTPVGPARIALQTGVPMLFGTIRRRPDGRHRMDFDPPYTPAGDPDEANVRALTAWHTARLEREVRAAPEHWFWLHRRWKTAPPPSREDDHASV
jgi:KDO2-lipid IV(A) lauroyltransferase